jgi:hypothetical protein
MQTPHPLDGRAVEFRNRQKFALSQQPRAEVMVAFRQIGTNWNGSR